MYCALLEESFELGSLPKHLDTSPTEHFVKLLHALTKSNWLQRKQSLLWNDFGWCCDPTLPHAWISEPAGSR